MSVAGRLAVVALRPLAEGALDSLGQAAGEAAVVPAAEFLAAKLTEAGPALGEALRKAMERTWKAVEITLNGGSWVRQISAQADNKALADDLGKLTIETEAALSRYEAQRRLAAPELRAARKKNYLNMPGAFSAEMAAGLARGAALYTRFDDFEVLLQADRSAVEQIAGELRAAGFANLASVLLPDESLPLIAVAGRYFFRRAVQESPPLAETFAFARFEELLPELQEAFDALLEILAHHGRRLEELLGNVAAAAAEPKIASLDVRDEAAATGAKRPDLYRDVADLMRRFGLTGTAARSHDANLIRNEHERQQIMRVVRQYRELPPWEQQQRPALANAAARLELAAGDAAGAVRDFQAIAANVHDPAAQGELHMNAHRAAVEQPDFATAIKEFLDAVKLDGRRFATFPVGKYIPMRVVGAGGFGTAFLCKHKYMNAQVVVKALATDDLERDVDDVFSEAQALGTINHPAIIRVQDCGYVDAGRKHRPFLVMDYFEAPTLREYVEQRGPLSVAELLALVEPVAAGLEAAHAKAILHRDIKPDNLLVKRLPDARGRPRWEVKLIDFGLSLRQQPALTVQGSSKVTAAGTTEYAAPEQLGRLPGIEAGPQSDIYSFGKTCCYALFQTTAPLLKHWTSIPQPLAELLERCLAEQPDERPKDFTVVSRCFARLNDARADIPVVGAADVRPASATALQTAPVARPARRADERDDDYEEYVEPRRKGGGGAAKILIVLGVVALLMLLICGGGGVALYYLGKSVSDSDTEVADSGGAANPAEAERPRGKDINPPAGGIGGDQPVREEKKKHNLTITGAPNGEVAEIVKDRVQGAENTHRAPRILSLRRDGNSVTAILEDNFGSDADGWLRDLELGAVEQNGDDFKVALAAPPEPQRKPATPLDLPKLSPVQFQAVVKAFSMRREEHEAVRLLKSTAPREEQRATIRSLLKTKVKDGFIGTDAIEALGNWGTAEDVPFLTSLDDGGPFSNEHVIHALERMRDPAGANYLARKLDNFFVGEKAYQALRAIGPAAEKEIQTALNGNQHGGALRACRLLKEYGSTASVEPLKAACRDKNGEVAKAAWDALKTIAYYPAKPVTVEPKMPVAAGPKATSNVDDLKVTTLDEAAATVSPNICVSADGQGFYTLDPAGVVARRDWDGKFAANTPTAGMKLMSVSREGLLVAGNADAKLLDALQLTPKNSGPMDNTRGLAAAPDTDYAIARCEGTIPGILVIDVGSFTVATTYADRKAGKAIVLPPGFGRTDPVLALSGRYLFTQGEGRLHRWVVNNLKISAQDSTRSLGTGEGKVVVSPDGKYVALLFHDAATTPVFAVTDLKKPAFTVNHGPRPTALAFDGKGTVYAATESKSLIRFDHDGKPAKEYDLGGATRQIVADRDGKRLLVLTKDKLLKVELP